MKKNAIILSSVLLLSLVLVACESISYYGQAAAGQLYILSHRENIEKLIDDESTAPELKARLSKILSIRTFAEQELLLPLERNYSTYVDVQKPYVVWNVFATPEFSMQPINWCYPIAGCVSYRGYFSEDRAIDFAMKLSEQGNDVYLGGVAAYSTLGWFSDSILNTIINREDYRIASLIFHELAHQLLYIPGDTEFNESFATAVEREGLRRWLEFNQNAKEEVQATIIAAQEDRKRGIEFVELVTETVTILDSIYKSELSEPDMRESKQAAFSRLQESYRQLKDSWNGYDGYDAWFSKELNNAQLSTVGTYFNWVPSFEKILEEEQGDLSSFYARVKSMEDLDKSDRQELLRAKQ